MPLQEKPDVNYELVRVDCYYKNDKSEGFGFSFTFCDNPQFFEEFITHIINTEIDKNYTKEELNLLYKKVKKCNREMSMNIRFQEDILTAIYILEKNGIISTDNFNGIQFIWKDK